MMVQAAAFAGALPWATAAVAQEEEVRTRRPRGFRIGVCDWNLGKTGDPGSFEAARQIGLDGVQVSLGTAANDMHLRKPEVQKAFLEASRAAGVRIASLAIGELNNIPYKSDPRTEAWVSDSIDVCNALRVRVVLLAFFGNGDLRDDPKGVDEVVERLRKIAPKAEDKRVILGIESWLSAADSMAIINRVGSPAVQVYYDVGNSHLRGYDIYTEIRTLGKNICEFHAKDYNHLFGKGKVDFVKVREAMDAIDYRGWIQIEGATPLGLVESYKQNAVYLRTVFPRRV
ncbi:MAG: sugar phosphate isomerase/epimerase [Phycisphaerae bacterium]|nr:sugar phosphate isomerase/epimerase [Phycisphaerae bacterium]